MRNMFGSAAQITGRLACAVADCAEIANLRAAGIRQPVAQPCRISHYHFGSGASAELPAGGGYSESKTLRLAGGPALPSCTSCGKLRGPPRHCDRRPGPGGSLARASSHVTLSQRRTGFQPSLFGSERALQQYAVVHWLLCLPRAGRYKRNHQHFSYLSGVAGQAWPSRYERLRLCAFA